MPPQKPGLHPRNRHNGRYDLATLCQVTPELTQFLTLTPGGEQSVDFANPQAVKALNKALLAHFYAVKNWDIPDGFLCPPVPGRADYIHHLADLLGETSGTIPANASVLDVGVGANCIYPLIGVHEYGWRFTGSETSSEAFNSAQAIVNANPGLTRAIRLRRQKDATAIFNGIIHKNEQYETTLIYRLLIWSNVPPLEKCSFCAFVQPPNSSSMVNSFSFGNAFSYFFATSASRGR